MDLSKLPPMDPSSPEFFASLSSLINIEHFRLASRFNTLASSTLLRSSPALENCLTNSTAKGLPPISVTPLAGQHLTVLASLMNVKTVLEIGTLGGYSSLCFAAAGAKVTSIELDPKHRDAAIENTSGKEVEVILGAAMEVMPRLISEGRKFDMVFIDADFDDQWEHFDLAVKLTRVGGCVFLDDVVVSMLMREGGVENIEQEGSVIRKIGEDGRVLASFCPVVATHPMVSEPIFNGYVMALVKSH